MKRESNWQPHPPKKKIPWGDSVIKPRPGVRWVYTFIVILRDVKLGEVGGAWLKSVTSR